jgi:hypothetical protein
LERAGKTSKLVQNSLKESKKRMGLGFPAKAGALVDHTSKAGSAWLSQQFAPMWDQRGRGKGKA